MVNYIYMDGSGHKMARPVTNREDYLALRNAPDNVKNFYDARSGNEQAKALQVQFCYNDLLPDGVLRGCCHPSSTFAHDIDCNDQAEQERIKQVLLDKKDEIGLLELSGSARYGIHAICRREAGKTIRECQYALSMATQTEYDTNARGLARVMYTGPATPDNLFYLDDALFEEPLSVEQSAEEYKQLKQRETKNKEEVPAAAKKANKHYRPWEGTGEGNLVKGEGRIDSSAPDKSPAALGYAACYHRDARMAESAETDLHSPVTLHHQPSTMFKGIPYSSIISSWWKNNGGEPAEGERNVKLYQLAVNLRAICDNNRQLLMEVMPSFGLSEQELQSIVESACKEPPKGISKQLREVLASLGQELSTPLAYREGMGESLPPEVPQRLPKLIQLLTSKTPDVYKAAVANAVFPPLATHLCEVRFCYTDNVEHEATLMNCLMAGTGAGKGCIDEPIRHIMADIKHRDEENERREAEWKKDCQKKGANKDKQVRPEGLIIQIIDSDMTKPALVTRMDEAEGHFVYVKLNELDLFEQLKGTTGKQHFQLMCLAFDPGAEYGQTRVGTQSVTARPVCRFNWNACTTILKGRKFFRNVLTDGPISRINFCTIPEMEIGCEQPVYGQYDVAFDEALKPYIDNLVSARGLIDCPQAYKLAKKLQEECAEFARLSQNETYWNLSHRACVIAWLKACVLYVANGQKWEKCIEDFIRWSLNYDLWCKMQFFGDDIEKAANGDASRIGSRGPQNLLELLPDTFTIEDAKRVRQQQGLSSGQKETSHMIRTWRNRGYCAQSTEHSFQKSEKYKSKQ